MIGKSTRQMFLRIACIVWMLVSFAPTSNAQSWPTYRHDNRRSGVTSETLPMPLHKRWVYQSPQPPQTAWTGPAKWDAWATNSGLQSMRNFDLCFYVTADEEHVYFGSSVDDAAHALRIEDGREQWVHFTGAAVRMPPTIHDGKVYFGSDDGKAYCCDAQTGDLIWDRRASDDSIRITSNRKLISLWPVRTGVMIHGTRATFAGSLVPWKPSFFCSVDAENGSLAGDACYVKSFQDVTLQGSLLASQKLIYVPQGRAAPLAIDRASGELRGSVGSAGGVFCILSPEEQLFAGPPNQKSPDDQVRIADLTSDTALISFNGTNRILIDQQYAYLVAEGKLRQLNRHQYVAGQQEIAEATQLIKDDPLQATSARRRIEAAEQQVESAWGWAVASDVPLEIIKAGDVIVLGLDEQVRALRADDGTECWSAKIEGAAHGLAVAAGTLYVSTDRGAIYAYGK